MRAWQAVADGRHRYEATLKYRDRMRSERGRWTERQADGDTIRYSQDERWVLQTLEKEDFQAEFLMSPPKGEEVLTIANGGEKMAQKSTYSHPKLSSGLILNRIDPGEEIGNTERAP